jgi:integrase
VLAFGVSEDRLPENVALGLRLPKAKTAPRFPYTDAEAVLILNSARRETAPALRWAHWVMAFSGCRVGEVLQLTAGDVRVVDGIACINVNAHAADKSVKNDRTRNVPLHPALMAEGFLDYARTVAGDAPLFPEKGLDKFGKRGGLGWKAVGEWVRETVGITEKTKAPNHSWRHRMEDELRAVETPEDARDALMGHARKTTGANYGVRGEALARLHRHLSKVPLPAGLVVPAAIAGA